MCILLCPQSCHELLEPAERRLEVVERVRVGDAKEPFAAVAERGAGDDGDLFLLQKAGREVVAGHAELADVREDVEGALRLKARQSHRAQRVEHEAASLVVGVAHHRDVVVAVLQCLDGRILAGGRSAHDRVLVNLCHLLHEPVGAAGVAEAPAGHRICLGKAVYQHRSLLHAREGRDGDVRLAGVGQLRVDLVREHVEIMLDDDGNELFQVFLLHDRAGRVVREGEHEDLALVGDRRFELLRLQAEFVLRLQVDDDRDRVREDRARLIGDVARLGNDDFVALVDHRAEHEVDGLGAADGDQDFFPGIISDALRALDVVRDLGAELQESRVRGVERPAALQRIDALVAHVPRRVEVRLADAERDRVGHLADDVEEFPDAGGL